MNPALRPVVLLFALAGLAPPLAAEERAPGKLYTPGPFDGLSFNGSAQVTFRQGPRDEVFIEGDDEVQKEVELRLNGSTLTLRSSGSWRFWSPTTRIRVQVQARELRYLGVSGAANFHAPEPTQLQKLNISISGAGQVRFEQLRADELRFGVSGSGDGVFTGQVRQLALHVSGRSDLEAEGLQVQRAKVRISGLGKAKLWVQEELDVQVSGIGTVAYWGSPKVERHSSGFSSIKALGPQPPGQPAAAAP